MGTPSQHAYFTELTLSKAILYTLASLYVSAACVVVMLQPFLIIPCSYSPTPGTELETLNVLYHYNPCRMRRFMILLGLTVEECEFGRRLVWAVVLGCLIGWERKQADRPAGIRTMSLVALGSCLFSICSAFAFLSGPMAWDASRVSAAIPSGVGFLGSALIFKNKDDETNTHEVHGLTTAASVWLSAAVGIACAGGMYFVASLSTAIMLVLLRFGPRTNMPLENIYQPDDSSAEDENQQALDEEQEIGKAISKLNAKSKKHYQSLEHDKQESQGFLTNSQRSRETHSLMDNSRHSHKVSLRNRPSLL